MAEDKDHWMQGAVKHEGSFTRSAKKAGVPTQKFAREKKNAPGLLGKRARLDLVFAKSRNK